MIGRLLHHLFKGLEHHLGTQSRRSLEAVAVQLRAGKDKRVEPGDPLSQAARKRVQRYNHYALDRAENYYIHQRQVLGEPDRNIRPLGTQQVHNILRQEEHCEQDPYQQRELSRKREFYHQLSRENVDDRLSIVIRLNAFKSLLR